MKYMLDTNICIYLMNEAPPSVLHRFAQCQAGEITLSAVTWAELCCGLDRHHGQYEMQTLFQRLTPVAFTMDAAATFGALSRQFANRKNSFDRMIAAHAMTLNVTLVSNNTADFLPYQSAGLKLENWVA